MVGPLSQQRYGAVPAADTATLSTSEIATSAGFAPSAGATTSSTIEAAWGPASDVSVVPYIAPRNLELYPSSLLDVSQILEEDDLCNGRYFAGKLRPLLG